MDFMEQFLIVLLIAVAAVWLCVVFIGPPYVPTLAKDLAKLFQKLQLGPDDHVVDLGAGDGRVLKRSVAAGARATGVEINPMLSWIARWRLRGTGAVVVTKNMWHFELPADVSYVFIFCASKFIFKMEGYFEEQAAMGKHFRVISYAFTFPHKDYEKTIGPFFIYAF